MLRNIAFTDDDLDIALWTGDGRAVLTLSGQLTEATCPWLTTVLASLDHGIWIVALDLAAVDHVDLDGIKCLLDNQRSMGAAGRTLEVAQPTPSVCVVLHMAGVEVALDVP